MTNESQLTYGDHVRRGRLNRGLNQSDLAARVRAAGVSLSRPQLSLIEAGGWSPSVEVADAISAALGVDPEPDAGAHAHRSRPAEGREVAR